jgi:hypothetical protein
MSAEHPLKKRVFAAAHSPHRTVDCWSRPPSAWIESGEWTAAALWSGRCGEEKWAESGVLRPRTAAVFSRQSAASSEGSTAHPIGRRVERKCPKGGPQPTAAARALNRLGAPLDTRVCGYFLVALVEPSNATSKQADRGQRNKHPLRIKTQTSKSGIRTSTHSIRAFDSRKRCSKSKEAECWTAV